MKSLFKKYHLRQLSEITGYSIGTLRKMRAGKLPNRITMDENKRDVPVARIAFEKLKQKVRDYERAK